MPRRNVGEDGNSEQEETHVGEDGNGEQEETQSVHPSLGNDSELSSLSEGTEDSEGSTMSFDSRGFESDDPVEGFWYLVLSRDEYLEWKRPGTIAHTC